MGASKNVYFELTNMCASKQLRINRYWFFMVLNMLSLVALGIIGWHLT